MMDNLLRSSASRMFALGVIFLTFCATKSQIQCDFRKQYAVLNNTSGEILSCRNCQYCQRGFEPVRQCGTIIGFDVQLGICQKCKPGYFSAAAGVLPCQPCESSKCSRHEIIEGSCMVTNDTSRCAGHCKDGYTMNSNGTCEAVIQLQPSTAVFVSIVLSLVLASALILIVLLFVYKSKRRLKPARYQLEGKVCQNASAHASMELLQDIDHTIIEPESPESWKWIKSSIIHREKFERLLEYAKEYPDEIKDINGVRVCCSKEFLIGRGSDGTKVYIGLGKDGYERAVKRLSRDDCAFLAEHEKEVLNATESNYVVRYWYFDDKSDKDWLFLIMDLCEESLKEFVERSRLDDVATSAQTIIKDVLKGLVDLHRDSKPILHRDLKPSNILRNVNGRWLLADFGISRIMTDEASTMETKERGTKHWRAAESCSTNGIPDDDIVRYKKKSDIQVAGMVAFYVATKGEHPFGEEADCLRNLLDGEPVGLKKLKDPAEKDLISWMLSHEPKDRPSAKEALKHPYFQPVKEQFEMLCKMGNEQEIKRGDTKSDVVRELNSELQDWRSLVRPDILEFLGTDTAHGKKINYKSSWTDCLRLMRNAKTHWNDHPRPRPAIFYSVGDPQEYFLNLFPNLPVVVHRIVRSCDWKERPDLKEYFGELPTIPLR